ncbi:BTB/POZ domain-containing protein 3-like [Sitodiplosis mosellana]|uniref:BTB/POZ domain-containing protein 3-like n=1 Tax=Sitodiplosis mosellana TaxID=263140 RepID=UPI0024447761|nr:BTB/POZ domain-containing protein 3-like [Sitodiplosis mosellana]
MSQSSNETGEFSSPICSMIGEKLYLSETMADFHFLFETNDGEYERVPAHRNFLIAASDVFEAMFNGSWEEMNEVEIVDSPVAAFKEFLQFFYLGRVKITAANVAKVMYLANKYNLADGLNMCSQFLMNVLTDDNACWCYDLANLFQQQELKKYCETVFTINTKAVLKSTSFLECDREVLGHIIKIDSLNCSEVDIFGACMSWVEAVSKQAILTKELIGTHLGDVFHYLCFGSMVNAELAAIVPTYGNLFSIDEYKDIIQMMASPGFQPTIFKANRRKPFEGIQWDEEATLECDRLKTESRNVRSVGHRIKTTFSTNKPILLGGFRCCSLWYNDYGSDVGLSDIDSTEMKIVEVAPKTDAANGVVLYNEIRSDCYLDEQITLPMPRLIRPGFMYEIQLEQEQDDFCTRTSLKSEVKMEPDIIVQFHPNSMDEDVDNETGIIQKLYFNRIV